MFLRFLFDARAFRAAMVLVAILLAVLIGLNLPSVTHAANGVSPQVSPLTTAAPPAQEIPTAKLSPELLASIVTIVFSLAFAYLPGVKNWYGAQDSERKAMIMGIVILLVGLGSFGASCGGFVQLDGVACTQAGVVTLIQTVVFALLSSVGSYTLLVKPFQRPNEPTISHTTIGTFARRG